MKNSKFLIPGLLIVASAFLSIVFIKDKIISSNTLEIQKASLNHEPHGGGHLLLTPNDMKFTMGPEVLPPGAKIAMLQGDMSKPGPFVTRLEFPANYVIPPHFHPAMENVTVLEGELYFGLGEKYDRKAAKMMPVGSLIVMPMGHKHFAFTQEKPTTIQLHSIGPWGITYVNPSDDPRTNAKK